jgi:hypothetical protein
VSGVGSTEPPGSGGGNLVERYLLLGLRLGRHVDGLVDAYYGPPELAARAEAEGRVDPAELAREARALQERLDELDDARRRRWLGAQLDGLETAARKLAGEDVPYREEVLRCYGVAPEPIAEEELREVHRRLDGLLPGDGDLVERYQAWRRAGEMPREAVLRACEAVAAELRRRTAGLFPLPGGEDCAIELVTGEPWAAFNYYLGGLRSRVVLNVDLPTRANTLAELAAHEIYPGHHTEHSRKEAGLVRDRGFLEESLFLVCTPQSLVSEGIASIALDLLGEAAERACAEILADLGAGYDVERDRTIRDCVRPLGRVYDNVAELLHERGGTADEALEHGLRWSLRPEPDVRKMIDFVTHPTWRAYAVTYSAGERLAGAWVGGEPARFERLLSEQLTTADLVGV